MQNHYMRFPGFLLILLAILSLRLSSAAHIVVAIQPLGKVDSALIQSATARLESTIVVTVIVLPVQPLPQEAYYAPRNRYRADKLLDWLALNTPPQYGKVIGITAQDISTTKDEFPDWGIFGLAYLSQRPAVISSFRLGRNGASYALRKRRLAEVAVHELGHTFGLDHCPTPHCIMEDAKGTIWSVDESTGHICELCAKRLGTVLR